VENNRGAVMIGNDLDGRPWLGEYYLLEHYSVSSLNSAQNYYKNSGLRLLRVNTENESDPISFINTNDDADDPLLIPVSKTNLDYHVQGACYTYADLYCSSDDQIFFQKGKEYRLSKDLSNYKIDYNNLDFSFKINSITSTNINVSITLIKANSDKFTIDN
jgi:hypothetical protein